ncbi:hypothetical protein MKY22_01965 [Exiguobacterium sp. FSL W8-0210]|uniref:hypothetical protein n=1 Tax=Exiguobacterium sp. FSL W8-0210 TaxID=2921598 RepID=UPI0030FAF05B
MSFIEIRAFDARHLRFIGIRASVIRDVFLRIIPDDDLLRDDIDQLTVFIRERSVLPVTEPDVDDDVCLTTTGHFSAIERDLLISFERILRSRRF